MQDVYVVGVGMHPFGRWPDLSLRDLAIKALVHALGDARVTPGEIGSAYVANSLGGLLFGQESIRGQVILRSAGFREVPVVNVENACASGATAFRLACMDVALGRCEVALALGVEKLYTGDTPRVIQAMASATDFETVGSLGAQFMALYAMQVQRHMGSAGWTLNDLAIVTVKSRANGARNPFAQYRSPVTVEQVLQSRPIAGPLTLLMCSGIGDGAAAVIVGSKSVAQRRGYPLIRVVASVLRMGGRDFIADPPDRSSVHDAVWAAYEQAGLGPEDLEVIEVHDAVAPAEIRLYEELGLCVPGDGVNLLRSGATQVGGQRPVNPSGGLVARGHPVGATGLAQIAEVVWQMRGEAAERQVPGRRGSGPRVALCENNGGFMAGDVAAIAVHIFQRHDL